MYWVRTHCKTVISPKLAQTLNNLGTYELKVLGTEAIIIIIIKYAWKTSEKNFADTAPKITFTAEVR